MIRRISLIAVAWATLLPAGARAQGDVQVLTIVNAGKTASTVDVFAFTNAGKTRVGTTGSDGAVRVEDAGFREGDRVAVWVRRCEDGRTEVVLVAEGGEDDRDPCAGEEEGEGCGCRRLGAFVWGRGSVTIELADGAPAPVRQGPGLARGLPRLQAGLGPDLFFLPNMDDACDLPGVVDCDADDFAAGVQAAIEYYRWRQLGLGLEVTYLSGLMVQQTFSGISPEGPLPERNTVDLDVVTAALRGIWRRPLGESGALGFIFGLYYAVNQGETETVYPTETVRRSHDDAGIRLGGGIAYDHWLRPGWGVRTEVGAMIGDGGDIDARIVFGVKLLAGLKGPAVGDADDDDADDLDRRGDDF